jgi:dihydroorotase
MRPCGFLAFLVLSSVLAAQSPEYDLLLKGGHILDPKNGVDAVRDLAIADGRIAAIEPEIPSSKAKKTLDAGGLYVTPGLIDSHFHAFAGTENSSITAGLSSIFPDHVTFGSCVTTVVDVGSSGWRRFEDFRREVIDRARTRVLAMINISGMAMVDYDLEQNPLDLEPDKTAEMAKKHSDVVVGIKSAHWRAPNFLSVRKAVEAGTLAGIPVMVDFGYFLAARPYQKMVLEILRPGDISTHMYRWPSPLLDENEKLRPYLLEARARGVKFDVGHGSGSFHFRNAEPAVRQGFWPDSISTDWHRGSNNGAMIDMTTMMSKFLALGVPLAEVVRQSTANPASQVNHPELGQIGVGAEADIALLRLDEGKFGYLDARGGRIEGSQRLGCEMTIRAGRVVFDFNGRAGLPWREAKIKYPTR